MGLAENTDNYRETAEAMGASFDDLIGPIQSAIAAYLPCTRAEAILVLEDLIHIIIAGKMVLGDEQPDEQYVRRRLEGYIQDDLAYLLERARKIHDPRSKSVEDVMALFANWIRRAEAREDDEGE